MSGFEEYYKNSEWFGTYQSDLMMKEAFEAGQQSMQAKVEELQKRVDQLEISQRNLEQKAEDAECVALCLDDQGVVKSDKNGIPFSLWGRVCQLKKTINITEDDLERIYWEFDSERNKSDERLSFKNALRGLLEQALKGEGQ